jgi:hypothetical protein
MRSRRKLTFLALILLAGLQVSLRAQEAPKSGQPRLRIETFGASRAYAVGQSSVTLIATIRNVGDAPLPEGTVNGRLTCVSGLDYGDGDTIPRLPALAPNALATYRWRVTPNAASGPLVAAFALEYPGATPDVRVTGIQRFSLEPLEGVPSPLPIPVARVQGERSTLENGKIRARIEPAASGVPGLWLSARSTNGWRKAGVSLPIAEVLSGEGGQEPWWEVFRTEEVKAVNGLQEASLLLTGGIGLRWRATLTLTLRSNSSVIDCDIRLAPLKSIKISGLRLATLFAGENSFGGEVDEELAYSVNGPNAVAAVRAGDLTVGASWPTIPFFKEWQTVPTSSVPGADYTVIGAEQMTSSTPVELNPGALVDFRCRLYAMTPSSSVRDAFQIIVPAQRSVAKPASLTRRLLASRTIPSRMSTSRKALILKRSSSSNRSTASKRKKSSSRKISARTKRGKHTVTRSNKRGGLKSRVSKASRSKRTKSAHRPVKRSKRRR